MLNSLEKFNLRGIKKVNEPMFSYTSWHIGGPADCYYQPADLADLVLFLKNLTPDEPLIWLGLGSNVLIADQGIRGTVIHTQNTLGKIDLMVDYPTFQVIRVEAGVPCAKIAKWCSKQGLSGGEFFAGIPGTMGGALAMNAGAFGGETWSHVEKVEVINRHGELLIRTPNDYHISYRSMNLNSALSASEWFVAGYLRFSRGNSQETESRIKAILRKRNESQPIGVFSCGSVFKNPPSDYAGRLIEASGLKGYKVGDAQISPKHGNFIINLGNASAQDVLALIQMMQHKVLKEYGVRLQTEVRLLGLH